MLLPRLLRGVNTTSRSFKQIQLIKAQAQAIRHFSSQWRLHQQLAEDDMKHLPNNLYRTKILSLVERLQVSYETRPKPCGMDDEFVTARFTDSHETQTTCCPLNGRLPRDGSLLELHPTRTSLSILRPVSFTTLSRLLKV